MCLSCQPLPDRRTSCKSDTIDILIGECISRASISIDLLPDGFRESCSLEDRGDELSCEDDFLRYLPDHRIAREEWLYTCPDEEHEWIVPRCDRSDDSLRLIVDGMDLRVGLMGDFG